MSRRTRSSRSSNIFQGLVISFTGTLSRVRSQLETLVTEHGGQTKSSVSASVTHLVTNDVNYHGTTNKIIKAQEQGINIVSEDFIHKSIELGSLQNDDKYFFEKAGTSVNTTNTATNTTTVTTTTATRVRTRRSTRTTTRRTAHNQDEDDDEDEDANGEENKPQTRRKRTRATRSRKDEEEEDEEEEELPKTKMRRTSRSRRKKEEDEQDGAVVEEEEEEEEEVVEVKKTKVIKRGAGVVDPLSGLVSTGEIYQDADAVYAVTLNQTNIVQNNNKFYIIQLIKHPNGYSVFTRWGRVGDRGQFDLKHFRDVNGARGLFAKKFKDKTGNNWEDRDNFVSKPRKYDIVQVSYESDDDEDGDQKERNGAANEENVKMPDSKLDKPLQDLMRMIADVDEMQATLKEFEIDVSRMPLGKLSNEQLKLGYEILKDLQSAIESGDRDEIVDLSSEFYTKIPHSVGRRAPPPIDTLEKLRVKIKMIESLADMEIASKLLTTKSQEENPIDAAYHSLRTELITLDHDSEEFKMIKEYVSNGHAPTHTQYTLELLDVFKVEREGERERFDPTKKYGNRRLLWHGSRTTNYMGILSQGLRIAPPEAPATGYMFGKGVYFADLVTKSANYCATTPSKNVGLMLLSEVSLGKMYERTSAQYITPQSLPRGCHSTWGKGVWIPDPSGERSIDDGEVQVPMGKAVKSKDTKQSSLLYNEYIVYDTAQVNLRYLCKMRFNYKRGSRW